MLRKRRRVDVYATIGQRGLISAWPFISVTSQVHAKFLPDHDFKQQKSAVEQTKGTIPVERGRRE